MVVDSSPASKQKPKDSAKKSGKNPLSPQRRRTKSSEVRVIGNRIYDSLNGKTCHQCRQKTMDFAAACKNQKQGKPCPFKFCHKCLLNRYGEKAEEVGMLEDWNCPKCRGICNCSVCMKRRGHHPTGILVHAAKATGYSSVSELLLNVKGPQNFCHNKDVKEMNSSSKKSSASKKENLMITPKKRGKENSFEGKINVNLQSLPLARNSAEKIIQDENEFKEIMHTESKKMHGNIGKNGALLKAKPTCLPPPKNSAITKCNGSKVMHNDDSDDLLRKTDPSIDEEKLKKIEEEGSKRKQDKKRTYAALLKESNRKLKSAGNEDLLRKNSPSCGEKIPKKMIQEGSNRMQKQHCNKRNNDSSLKEPTYKKHRAPEIASVDKVKTRLNVLQEEKDYGTKVAKEISLETIEFEMAKGACNVSRNTLMSQKDDPIFDILLPNGVEMTTVAGVDLPPEDVGNALQFLEFCAAFGKVLDVKKVQPQSVLRELIHGRSGRRGKYSSAVQFHIQLLSVIHEEMEEGYPTLTNGKNSWLHALRKCVSESHSIFDSALLDFLGRGDHGYDALDPSKKLKILNFLCDEVLGTVKIRNWIDAQNNSFVENVRKAKGKVLAAKEKEKSLRQKMQDQIAKAIIERNGAPLLISEHETIVSQIKLEAAQAHAEMLESKGMVPRSDQRSDAVRTKPILLDIKGDAYWRLKGISDKSDILCQHVGTGNAATFCEKWFAFDVEQGKLVDKHISALRAWRRP